MPQIMLAMGKPNEAGTSWIDPNITDKLISKMRNPDNPQNAPQKELHHGTGEFLSEDNTVAYITTPTLESMENIPETLDLITLLDTGGQPEFINMFMLPAIDASAAITFVVLNISEGRKCLDNPVVPQKNAEHCNWLKYNKIYLLKCLLSAAKVAAMKNDFCPEFVEKIPGNTQNKPLVCFMGTFANQLKTKFGEKYDEELSEINKKVKKLVDQEKILEIWTDDAGNHVNPVDITISRNLEISYKPDTILHITKETIKRFRAEANKRLKEEAQYKIPITWLILELALHKRKEACISLTDVIRICDEILPPHRTLESAQIGKALSFFHYCGTMLHFREVDGMKNFVITNPQWLFTNLAKIIMCKFDKKFSFVHDAEEIENLHNGICYIEVLHKFELDLQGVELESFINLLVHLKIIAPMDSGYFVPNLLPLSTTTNDFFKETEYGIQAAFTKDEQCIASAVKPLLIEFNFGTIPRGLFGFLIVQLLQDNSETYKIYGKNDQKSNIFRRFSDMITFRKKPSSFVTIIDKLSYLELQVRAQDKSASCHCEVQKAVTEALKRVCTQFQWKFSDCRYGFLCQKHDKQSNQHLSLLSHDEPIPQTIPDYTECRESQSTKIKIAKQIWFKV